MSELPPPPTGAPPPPPPQQPQVVYVPQLKKGGCLKGGLLTIAILAALGIGLIVVIAVALNGASDSVKTETTSKNGVSTGFGSKDASGDVKITACANDDVLDYGKATMTIKNRSSKRSDYLVTVVATSADGKTQVDSSLASANDLEAGQSTEADAPFTKHFPDGTVCKVTEVSRVASN